jgi:hypothetical protein
LEPIKASPPVIKTSGAEWMAHIQGLSRAMSGFELRRIVTSNGNANAENDRP